MHSPDGRSASCRRGARACFHGRRGRRGVWRRASTPVLSALLLAALLSLLPSSGRALPWRVYALQGDSLVEVDAARVVVIRAEAGAPPPVRESWELTAWELADVTGDDRPEWVLFVWRPWRDWAIQRWLDVPSPIAANHDAAGASCHLILLDPTDGHELWAGSALPAPLLAMAVGDVDGDGVAEVATLEGSYDGQRHGPASHLDVWQWVGFGFKLEARSEQGRFWQLHLTDAGKSGILDLAVR
jgi:hypothetical protein